MLHTFQREWHMWQISMSKGLSPDALCKTPSNKHQTVHKSSSGVYRRSILQPLHSLTETMWAPKLTDTQTQHLYHSSEVIFNCMELVFYKQKEITGLALCLTRPKSLNHMTLCQTMNCHNSVVIVTVSSETSKALVLSSRFYCCIKLPNMECGSVSCLENKFGSSPASNLQQKSQSLVWVKRIMSPSVFSPSFCMFNFTM